MSAELRILLPSQKKRVIELLCKHGLNIREFEWNETVIGSSGAPRVTRCSHIETQYYFLFDFYTSGRHANQYSPSADGHLYKEEHNDWEKTFKNVDDWARHVARELQAQSFLQSALEITPDTRLPFLEPTNRPFTAEEQVAALRSLQAVESMVVELVAKFHEHRESVSNQFDVLRDELKRTGRLGWLQMLVGTLVSVLAGNVEMNTARKIWSFVSEQLGSVYQGIQFLTK